MVVRARSAVDPLYGGFFSKLLNAAVSITGVQYDWDGEPRPSGGGPDVGADEYVGSATPTDTSAPTVSITSPTAGATVRGAVSLIATAVDNVGVTGVWFTVDGVTIGSEDTTAPYQTTWNTAAATNGSHLVRAVARDAAGNVATSAARTVTVANQLADTTAPTVALTSPASGAVVRGTVVVSADASDNVGVTSVQFTLNGVNLGTADTVAPYAINWNTTGAANGTHSLRAIAHDAAGNTTSSSVHPVTVSNPVTAPTPPATAAPATPGNIACAPPDPFIALGGGSCQGGAVRVAPGCLRGWSRRRQQFLLRP